MLTMITAGFGKWMNVYLELEIISFIVSWHDIESHGKILSEVLSGFGWPVGMLVKDSFMLITRGRRGPPQPVPSPRHACIYFFLLLTVDIVQLAASSFCLVNYNLELQTE